MTGKLPKTAMNLKQFLIRQEVLILYRDIMRSVKMIPDEKTRADMKEWAQTDFRNNMKETDDYAIKSLLRHGKHSLQQLRNSMALSTSQNTEKQ